MSIDLLNACLDYVKQIGEDENTFCLNLRANSSDANGVYLQDGYIMIDCPDYPVGSHEVTHVGQALNSSEGLSFDKAGQLKNPGKTIMDIAKNEVEAYRTQFAASKWGVFEDLNITSITQITLRTLLNFECSSTDSIRQAIELIGKGIDHSNDKEAAIKKANERYYY